MDFDKTMRINIFLRKKIINSLIKILLLTIIFNIFSCKIFDPFLPKITPEEMKDLKNVCKNLPVPDTFTKIGERNIEKDHIVVFITEYFANTDYLTVRKFYSDLLLPQGWKNAKNEWGETASLDFRKDRFLIEIKYVDTDSSTNKKFSIICSGGVPE